MMFHGAWPNETVRKAAQPVEEDFEKGSGIQHTQFPSCWQGLFPGIRVN